MLETNSAAQQFEAAFDDAIETYIELKQIDGSTWNQVYGNPHTHGNNPLLVKPSDQDFICDMELAFRTVLPTACDRQNLHNLIYGTAPVDPETKKRIVQRVGREIIRRGIHPMSDYFRGKEVDVTRKTV